MCYFDTLISDVSLREKSHVQLKGLCLPQNIFQGACPTLTACFSSRNLTRGFTVSKDVQLVIYIIMLRMCNRQQSIKKTKSDVYCCPSNAFIAHLELQKGKRSSRQYSSSRPLFLFHAHVTIPPP